MAKVMGTKRIGLREQNGHIHETHGVELDGLPSVEVEVKLTKHLSRMEDGPIRAEKTAPLVIKAAQAHIDALVADHAG